MRRWGLGLREKEVAIHQVKGKSAKLRRKVSNKKDGDFQCCTKVSKMRLDRVLGFGSVGITVLTHSTTCMLSEKRGCA